VTTGLYTGWAWQSCPANNCVDVWEIAEASYMGKVSMSWDQYGYFRYGSIELVRAHSGEDNPGTVCHELGHAVGLEHNSWNGSCMYGSQISGPDPSNPGTDDYITLYQYLYYQ
jgi:hypothetical protein